MPAGAPRTAIERLHREITLIVNAPDIRDKLLATAFEPIADTPGRVRALSCGRAR
jgi:hypothetical protein